MNAIKVYELVKKEFPHLEFELKKETKNETTFVADIVAEKYFDDSVYTDVVVYASGTVHVFFTLDEIVPSMDVYTLINEFNAYTSWLKAYIWYNSDDKSFLKLHYACPNSKNEKEAAEAVSRALNNLIDEDVLEFLVPLTHLTGDVEVEELTEA